MMTMSMSLPPLGILGTEFWKADAGRVGRDPRGAEAGRPVLSYQRLGWWATTSRSSMMTMSILLPPLEFLNQRGGFSALIQ